MTTTTDRTSARVALIPEDQLGRYARFLRDCHHWPTDIEDQREALAVGLCSLGEYIHADVRPNGYIDPYPHDDLEHPCVGQCCEPEAYISDDPRKPLLWSCDGTGIGTQFARCSAKLIDPGTCLDCTK